MEEKDSLSLKLFVGLCPAIILLVAFINYCFAGVCPRYLNDIAPFASILGGLLALKTIEKNNQKHPVVPSLITALLVVNILLTGQYHFEEFDGLKIGDFEGLLGIIRTIPNHYN